MSISVLNFHQLSKLKSLISRCEEWRMSHTVLETSFPRRPEWHLRHGPATVVGVSSGLLGKSHLTRSLRDSLLEARKTRGPRFSHIGTFRRTTLSLILANVDGCTRMATSSASSLATISPMRLNRDPGSGQTGVWVFRDSSQRILVA